jgi:hypothetical protein
MAGKPGRLWANAAVLLVIAVVGGGWLLVALTKVRREAWSPAATQHYLKQVGLGSQNFHDTYLRFAGNGTGVGDGFPTPDAAADGSFFYQILPYMEQEDLYRRPRADGAAVKSYLEPARRRAGTGPNGPVTDVAVNLIALYGEGKPPTAANTKGTLNLGALQDGASNIVLAGIKALHPTDYRTTDPAVDDTFLKLLSGGTSPFGARYTVGATTSVKALTAPPPAEFLTPTLVRDQDAARGVASDQFGGPDPTGVLFAFFDGSVRHVNYQWAAAPMAISPAAWGTPPTAGTFDRVSQLRAALTPNELERVTFE